MFGIKQRLIGVRLLLFAVPCLIYLTGCSDNSKKDNAVTFNYKDSDPKAIEIADQVMEACGGKANWDNTHYVAWRCFGKRLNVWDKWTGDIRVESRISIILMNLNTMKGKAWKTGSEITDPDELKRALQYGYEAWMNDSYWVFMPFKLKDPGVTLKYLGEGEIGDKPVDIISVTFKDVGATPENKYHVYVDKESKLVVFWDFFMDASDQYPRISVPWQNYQKYGNILLSDDRGKEKHTDLAVFDELPASVFKGFERVNVEELIAQENTINLDKN